MDSHAFPALSSWVHCHTAQGQWAVGLLQCTASLLGGNRHCNSCNVRSHQARGRGVVPRRRSLPKERYSYNALPHCLGAVGSATPAMHCRTPFGLWAVQLPQCTASLPGGSGRCNSRNTMRQCLGVVGSRTPATYCLTAWGKWAVQLLQCTASLLGGNGHCNSCNVRSHQARGRGVVPGRRWLPKERYSYTALPHCLGAVGSATLAMHCRTPFGLWAVQLPQCTASLPGGSGRCNSRNTMRQCLGVVGSRTPATYCLTTWGQRAVQLLQCTTVLPKGSG